jgi:hypothetical protein
LWPQTIYLPTTLAKRESVVNEVSDTTNESLNTPGSMPTSEILPSLPLAVASYTGSFPSLLLVQSGLSDLPLPMTSINALGPSRVAKKAQDLTKKI